MSRKMLATAKVRTLTPNDFLEFIKYSTEQIVSIFNNLSLPESLGDEFKGRFSEELVKNVFREGKRTELCLNEADIV